MAVSDVQPKICNLINVAGILCIIHCKIKYNSFTFMLVTLFAPPLGINSEEFYVHYLHL